MHCASVQVNSERANRQGVAESDTIDLKPQRSLKIAKIVNITEVLKQQRKLPKFRYKDRNFTII